MEAGQRIVKGEDINIDSEILLEMFFILLFHTRPAVTYLYDIDKQCVGRFDREHLVLGGGFLLQVTA